MRAHCKDQLMVLLLQTAKYYYILYLYCWNRTEEKNLKKLGYPEATSKTQCALSYGDKTWKVFQEIIISL